MLSLSKIGVCFATVFQDTEIQESCAGSIQKQNDDLLITFLKFLQGSWMDPCSHLSSTATIRDLAFGFAQVV